MEAKTFSVRRTGKPNLHATGFPTEGSGPFVTVKVGDTAHEGEFTLILYMPDARALAAALANAIDHAEPRSVEAADLGIAAE